MGMNLENLMPRGRSQIQGHSRPRGGHLRPREASRAGGSAEPGRRVAAPRGGAWELGAAAGGPGFLLGVTKTFWS